MPKKEKQSTNSEEETGVIARDRNDQYSTIPYENRVLDTLASILLVDNGNAGNTVAAVCYYKDTLYLSYNKTPADKYRSLVQEIWLKIKQYEIREVLKYHLICNQLDFQNVIRNYLNIDDCEISSDIKFKINEYINVTSKILDYYLIEHNDTKKKKGEPSKVDAQNTKLDSINKCINLFTKKAIVEKITQLELMSKKTQKEDRKKYYDKEIQQLEKIKKESELEVTISTKEDMDVYVVEQYFDLLNLLTTPNIEINQDLAKLLLKPLQYVMKFFNFYNTLSNDLKILPNEALPGKTLHAEMNIKKNFPSLENNYIGISRLSCACCDEVFKMIPLSGYRGTHGLYFSDWTSSMIQFEDVSEKNKKISQNLRHTYTDHELNQVRNFGQQKELSDDEEEEKSINLEKIMGENFTTFYELKNLLGLYNNMEASESELKEEYLENELEISNYKTATVSRYEPYAFDFDIKGVLSAYNDNPCLMQRDLTGELIE